MNVCGKDISIERRIVRIAKLTAEKYEFIDDPAPFVDALRESGACVDLFTFMEGLSHTTPRYPYPMEWDNLAAVSVSSFEHWWTRQINGKTRNMVRRAEKRGVTVKEVPFDDALVRGISAIYDESPVRQGKPFAHYRKGFDAVRRENGTFLDRSTFLGAFREGQLVGFAKLVRDEDRQQAALMQIVSMLRHREDAPANALIAGAIRLCASEAIPNLVYSSFAYGRKERDSLSDFKEHNGFKRVDLPRYYVPLTVTGRAALHLRLHHGPVAYIPEPLLACMRDLRRRWAGRRLAVLENSGRGARMDAGSSGQTVESSCRESSGS
jgi:hypothetical protein